MASSKDKVVVAVQRFQAAVPAFAKLKLIVGLELTAGGLTGPQESENFRIEVPGPKVAEAGAEDARIQLALPRTMFDVLAEEAELADWKDAYYYGHLKVTGDGRVKRLLGKAIDSA